MVQCKEQLNKNLRSKHHLFNYTVKYEKKMLKLMSFPLQLIIQLMINAVSLLWLNLCFS